MSAPVTLVAKIGKFDLINYSIQCPSLVKSMPMNSII